MSKWINSWIGVDLDGTLAEYHRGDIEKHGIEYIGDPIPAMQNRVLDWLNAGKRVRIFTARISAPREGLEVRKTVEAIEAWCMKHLGRIIPITCTKDYGMIELWDDRAVQVVSNTGERVDGK